MVTFLILIVGAVTIAFLLMEWNYDRKTALDKSKSGLVD